MSITYRGVPQSDIAQSIESLARRLLTLNVGPLTNATAELWLSEDGVAAQIRTASSKTQIEKALEMKAEKSIFGVSGWLGNLYKDLLPNVFAGADHGTQAAMFEEIKSVYAWNGFFGTGRFHAMYPEDHEVGDYCNKILGIDYNSRSTFSTGVLKGAYKSYQVYSTLPGEDAVAKIVAFAKAQDAEDEFGGTDYSNRHIFYATPALAQKALDGIPALQALGHEGQLLQKSPQKPPAPKRVKTAPKPKR